MKEQRERSVSRSRAGEEDTEAETDLNKPQFGIYCKSNGTSLKVSSTDDKCLDLGFKKKLNFLFQGYCKFISSCKT